MKVAVIVPQVFNCINNAPSRWIIFPVESASAGAALKRAGHEVLGIDLNMLTEPVDAALEAQIQAFQPDAAVFVPQWLGRYDMDKVDATGFETLRRVAPDCVIINAGIQATLYPEMELENGPSFDYGLRGEVEETLPALLEIVATGQGTPEEIPGIFFGGHVSEAIPTIDLAGIDAVDENIFSRKDYLGQVERGNYRYPRNGQPLTYAQTSRGCHYKCKFCSIIHLRDYTFRQKRLEVIFREIENALAAGAKEIHFLDELFGQGRAFLEAFCGEIERRGLVFDWFVICGLPVGSLDLELLQRLERAGMYRLFLPFESANPRVLNRLIKKPHTPAQGWEVAQAVKKTGIQTIAAFLIGMPGETRAEMAESVAMAREIDFDYTLFSIATPIAGSPLEADILAQGLADKAEIREKTLRDSVFFETGELKERDLMAVRWQVWSEINFHSAAKTEKIADMFGISVAEAAAMGEGAHARFQERFGEDA